MTEAPVTLYVKAAKDGKSVGDCPFCHKTILSLQLQGIPFRMQMIDTQNKPEEYLRDINPKGTVPSAVTSDGKIWTDSEDIVKNLCGSFFVDTSLVLGDAGTLLPSFVGVLKSLDDESHAQKRDELSKKFYDLAVVIGSIDGPFFGGNKFNFVDCKLLPLLYHIKHAGEYHCNFSFRDYEPVNSYFEKAIATATFQQNLYSPDEVIHGWSKFVKK